MFVSHTPVHHMKQRFVFFVSEMKPSVEGLWVYNKVVQISFGKNGSKIGPNDIIRMASDGRYPTIYPQHPNYLIKAPIGTFKSIEVAVQLPKTRSRSGVWSVWSRIDRALQAHQGGLGWVEKHPKSGPQSSDNAMGGRDGYIFWGEICDLFDGMVKVCLNDNEVITSCFVLSMVLSQCQPGGWAGRCP